MPNPENELDAVVRRLRKKVLDYKVRPGAIKEQNTKIALINPLLVSLGWDIEDLEEVSCEYRKKPQDNPVDYALFLRRTPCLCLEAKALGSNLDDRRWITQTLSYAFVVGVEWCVLTDGNEYRLYNVAARVDPYEMLFRTVEISDEAQHKRTLGTLQLLSKDRFSEKGLSILWNAEYVDRRVCIAFENLVKSPDTGLVKLLRRQIEGLSSIDIRNSLQRADIRIQFPEVQPSGPAPAPEVKKQGVSHPEQEEVGVAAKSKVQIPVSLNELIVAGLIQTPLRIESIYLDVDVEGRIVDEGGVEFDGVTYQSLSEAAGMARVKVKGPPSDGRKSYQTNGWTWWKARDASTGRLVSLDEFRQRYLAQSERK